MIKIYLNEENQLECHVNVGGHDFKFQIDRDFYSATFHGSELPEYNKFEEYLDEDGEILSSIQNIMFELTRGRNWRVLFENLESDN